MGVRSESAANSMQAQLPNEEPVTKSFPWFKKLCIKNTFLDILSNDENGKKVLQQRSKSAPPIRLRREPFIRESSEHRILLEGRKRRDIHVQAQALDHQIVLSHAEVQSLWIAWQKEYISDIDSRRCSDKIRNPRSVFASYIHSHLGPHSEQVVRLVIQTGRDSNEIFRAIKFHRLASVASSQSYCCTATDRILQIILSEM